jgi:hypothetical protein
MSVVVLGSRTPDRDLPCCVISGRWWRGEDPYPETATVFAAVCSRSSGVPLPPSLLLMLPPLGEGSGCVQCAAVWKQWQEDLGRTEVKRNQVGTHVSVVVVAAVVVPVVVVVARVLELGRHQKQATVRRLSSRPS